MTKQQSQVLKINQKDVTNYYKTIYEWTDLTHWYKLQQYSYVQVSKQIYFMKHGIKHFLNWVIT